MNIEKINNLADLLETAVATRRGLFGKIGFNMREWVTDEVEDLIDECKTTACLAGWTILAEDEDAAGTATYEPVRVRNKHDWSYEAAKVLGLNAEQATRLFYGGGGIGFTVNRSPAEAIATLRHLAATGEVVWFPKPVGAGAPVGDGR